jgi:hypothetical protein
VVEVELYPPGAICTLVAPAVAQLSVLLAPTVMLAGLAEKELITGEVGVDTVTDADAVTDPAALVAVNTYVVVASGLTSVDPLAALSVIPPGLIERLVAPDVVQLSVLALPSEIPAGLAVNELIVGRFGLVTVTVAVAVTDPDVFVAVSV